MEKVKLYVVRVWNWLLGKTTIDEKVVEVVTEAKKRATRVKQELGDVADAVEKTIDQLDDVVDAAKGKPRKGRKPAAKKPAAKKTTAKKPAAKKTTKKGTGKVRKNVKASSGRSTAGSTKPKTSGRSSAGKARK